MPEDQPLFSMEDDRTTLRLIAQKVDQIETSISLINKTLKEEVVTSKEFNAYKELAKAQREPLLRRISDLEDDNKKKRWALYGSVVAAVVSALAALVTSGIGG